MHNNGCDKKPYGQGDDKAGIPPLVKTKKLHIGCLANSKVIAYAKTSIGTAHDSPFFEQIVSTVCNNGFSINTCLADAGYCSKANYSLCQDLGIKNVFIDFRSNVTGKRPKSQAWRDSFRIYKGEEDIWHENYRFRVLVESTFSVIKRKFLNWLRNKNETARENEMLLKALCYNLTILARYSN
jgi:transposase